jgi:hypothetical protein
LFTQTQEAVYCIKADMKFDRHELGFLISFVSGDSISLPIWVTEGKEAGSWQLRHTINLKNRLSPECSPQSPKPFIEAQKPLSQVGIKESKSANNPESSENKTASE